MERITDIALNQALVGWLGVLGAVLGIAGIAYAIVSNNRNKRAKEPYWAVQSYSLVTHSRATIPDLEVSFQGRRVETVTISELLFWNNGRETINGSDVAAANPLRIVPYSGTEILSASVVATNSRSRPEIAPNLEGTKIQFDYLDQGQGIVFRIVHTGTHAEPPEVLGDIRGATPLRETTYFLRDLMQRPRPPVTRSESMKQVLGSVFGWLSILAMPIAITVWALFEPVFIWLSVAIWLMVLVIYGYRMWTMRDSPPPQPVGFLPIEESDPAHSLGPQAPSLEPLRTRVRRQRRSTQHVAREEEHPNSSQ